MSHPMGARKTYAGVSVDKLREVIAFDPSPYGEILVHTERTGTIICNACDFSKQIARGRHIERHFNILSLCRSQLALHYTQAHQVRKPRGAKLP